ncbi:MAG: alpha/beta hydrolase [Planctomycetota bacterium]|nr:MAG: alpha/beta hydrolase [Planctomycetota bacterium]
MPRSFVAIFCVLFFIWCILDEPLSAQDSTPQPGREEPSRQNDKDRNRLLKKYDKDGDGKISSAEIQAVRRERRRSRPPLPPANFADVSYGKHPHQKLDLWLAKSSKPTPLVVHFHGGGFAGHSGSRHSLNRELLAACLKAGISVATADYRVTEDATLPIPMHDAARSIQFLRYHAKKYKLDPRKVAAHGGSGGGGISLWLAYHDDLADSASDDPIKRQSSRLTCAVVRGAQTSYDPRFIDKLFSKRDLWSDTENLGRLSRFYGLAKDEIKTERAYKLYEEAAPITHVSVGDPPVYMFYGVPDGPVTEDTPQGIWVHHPRFAEPLKQKAESLKLELVVKLAKDYPKGGSKVVTADMIAFLKRHFDAVDLPTTMPRTEGN